MKKKLTVLVAITLLAGLFAGFPYFAAPGMSARADVLEQIQPLQVVCTIFPGYDWVRQILGENAASAELTLLLDNGVDLHSYQPTAEDMIKISNCDLFVYVGGESDGWVEDALKDPRNGNRVVINLLETLGEDAKEEELVEGMEEDHDHGEEILESEIQDRPLADFAGRFQSVLPYFEDGTLDEYMEHEAEESGRSFEETKADFLSKRATEFQTLEIDGDRVTAATAAGAQSAAYDYAGFHPLKNEEGEISSVWYAFESKDAAGGMPRYLAFSDHSIASGHAEDEEEGEEHEEDHDHEETAHFHLRYGDESIQALVNAKNWAPTFYDAAADAGEIQEAVSGHGHAHEGEMDEHVWLSLKNAKILCSAIAETLRAIDGENAEAYAQNAAAYLRQLDALDEEYKAVVGSAKYDTLLFGDRFPFRYLVDDYGLQYYAAFSGCSAETEASFETIAFLANKVDEMGLSSVVTIEGAQHRIAETIVENTKEKKQAILTLDSMQSVTSRDVEAGKTYLSIMESNLKVLKDALN